MHPSLKRKHKILFLALFVLAVVLILFSFAPNALRLSPQEIDYTELGLPGIMYAIQSDLTDQRSFFGGGLDLNRTGESCSEPITRCESFSSKVFIIKSPHKLGPLEMKRLFDRPDIQAELARLEAEINDWVASIQCPEGCTKNAFGLNVDFHIQPAPGQSFSCSLEGKKSTKRISVSSANSLPVLRCELAGYSAASKFQDELRAFLKETCGSKCGYQINANFPLTEINETEKECKVSISSDVTISCTGRPVSDEYYFWIEADVCVSCEEPAKT